MVSDNNGKQDHELAANKNLMTIIMFRTLVAEDSVETEVRPEGRVRKRRVGR